jgi:hypothetical protein
MDWKLLKTDVFISSGAVPVLEEKRREEKRREESLDTLRQNITPVHGKGTR